MRLREESMTVRTALCPQELGDSRQKAIKDCGLLTKRKGTPVGPVVASDHRVQTVQTTLLGRGIQQKSCNLMKLLRAQRWWGPM